MPTLEDAAHAWALANPETPTHTSWLDGCARCMWDFNASFTKNWGPKGNITTAMYVMANSAVFEPVNVNDIMPGRFVWISLSGVPAGHVGMVVSGQGLDALVFWATATLTVEWAPYLGLGTVRDYLARKKGSKFVGASEDYAGAIPNLSAFSGGGVTPIPEDDMAYTILAANDAPLLNTWAYIGLPLSFVFSADAGTNLAQKQLVAAINGIADVNALAVTPISSVGMQNAIGLINAQNPATTLSAAQITALGQTVAAGITIPTPDLSSLAKGTDLTALGVAVGNDLAALAKQIPTPAQNGAAARAAIVAPAS